VMRGMQCRNSVGDAGACWLGHGLKSNTSVQNLNLVSFVVDQLLLVTRWIQGSNRLTVVGICHIMSCILHNDTLHTIYFDHEPPACVGHDAWKRDWLPALPGEVNRQGWPAVLKVLRRKVRNRGLFLKLSRMTCAA
jgi:hypothetical protein